MKETELAQKFVEYFSCYDLYFEVDYAGHSIDIVALAEKISIAIEVKTTFNFKVLEQAIINKPHFNYSYIAVPRFKDWSIQETLCEDYGIGLLIYDEKYNNVKEFVSPKISRISSNSLISRLVGYNKLSTPGAKSGDGKKVTAFQITVENMINYVRRHPGCTIKEMNENISHHYNSNKAACNNAYQWIQKGVIKELKIENKQLFLTI